VIPDPELCYRAVQSRDARFDGWFFTAVSSTGIYCRPSCPAVTPKRENMRFFATAAAAQLAGFRACKRCRPDASPGSPEWNSRADLVGRAMRLIADGVVDRDGVRGLAERLGYSERHLNRQLLAEVGAGPLALARAQRAQTARILIETTDLTFAQVAFAAGFASIRQFNDTVREVFAATPTVLRTGVTRREPRASGGHIQLRLSFRAPLHSDGLFGFLADRAVPGVEEAGAEGYRRTLRLAHGSGVVALVPGPDHVACRLRLDDVRDLTSAVQRCRRLLDLDADPVAVDAQLGADRVLRSLVARGGGRRVPGCVDGAEIGVRAVLGQQVSVAGARTLAGRLVARYGKPLTAADGTLTHLFPDADALVDVSGPELGIPAARGRGVAALARAVAGGDLELDPGADRRRTVDQLMALAGIGPWTASYVAMRGLGDPDVFLAGDLGVRRALQSQGLAGDPRTASALAERWRPWRSYALQYLWSADAAASRSVAPRRAAPRPAASNRVRPHPKEGSHA
jgi:AraC family transcriptional regulator of adaptative response / DNA-3-methyladenine glycosylase II